LIKREQEVSCLFFSINYDASLTGLADNTPPLIGKILILKDSVRFLLKPKQNLRADFEDLRRFLLPLLSQCPADCA
jgi:hypothetical protein